MMPLGSGRRAELDAYCARLYGLSRGELQYVLEWQDVYGSDFPGETFRVLTKSPSFRGRRRSVTHEPA